MFEMKLATCAALMGVLPESTGSLKTSYFSRESISRAARPKEARGVYLPLNTESCSSIFDTDVSIFDTAAIQTKNLIDTDAIVT